MKLLDNANLNEVGNIIAQNAIDCTFDFRLESYSCKMVSSDKKSWRKNMHNPASELQQVAISEDVVPISTSLTVSSYGNFGTRFRHYSERSASGGSDNDADDSLGQISGTVSRKTLFNLSQALNTSYPDYDFSSKRSDSYVYYASFQEVKEVVDKHLSATVDNYNQLQYNLWGSIEKEIIPSQCNIYSYVSSCEGDPFNEDGVIWSLNFMFFNKSLRRILLLSCRAIHQNSEEESDDIDYVMDYSD